MTTTPDTNQPKSDDPEGPISQVAEEGRFGANRAEDPYEPGRRASYAFRISVGVLIVALFLGAWWLGRDNRKAHAEAQRNGGTSTSETTRRVFFGSEQTDSMGQLVDPQAAAAKALMAGWWSTHDTKTHDVAFTQWLAATLPGPSGDRSGELAQVQAAVKTQRNDDSKFLPAAHYLSKLGVGMAPAKEGAPAPIWALETAAQTALYDATTGQDRATWAKDAVTLASQVAAKAQTRLQLSAPYVTDPSLAPGLKIVKKGACPCSFPAPHAAVAAAARTLLGALQPASDGEYSWMQRQVDYSSLFLGHAYPSDLAGGTLLGDAVGEYVLVTRAGQQPAAAP